MKYNQNILEENLILLCEDKTRLGCIYDATYSAVYAYVLGIVKNRECAKDITHDVYITIYCNCNKYEPKGHPMAWIYAIAKNTTKMYLRKHSWETTVEETIEVSGTQEDVIGNVSIQYLLKYLNEEEREIVLMRAISDLSFKDIAKTLELSISTVLSKYHRAIKKLKKHAMEVTI